MKFTPQIILASALCFTPLSVLADGEQTTITINGYIVDNTCVVSEESLKIPVDLQTNNAKDFFRVGTTGPAQPFSIILAPCGQQVGDVKVQFSGVADDTNTDLLKINSGNGTASGVGIELLDNQQQQIALNSDFSSLTAVSLEPGTTNTLTYYARLMSTHYPVGAGAVSATATFTLEYQ